MLEPLEVEEAGMKFHMETLTEEVVEKGAEKSFERICFVDNKATMS